MWILDLGLKNKPEIWNFQTDSRFIRKTEIEKR